MCGKTTTIDFMGETQFVLVIQKWMCVCASPSFNFYKQIQLHREKESLSHEPLYYLGARFMWFLVIFVLFCYPYFLPVFLLRRCVCICEREGEREKEKDRERVDAVCFLLYPTFNHLTILLLYSFTKIFHQ